MTRRNFFASAAAPICAAALNQIARPDEPRLRMGIAATSYINGRPVASANEFLEHANKLGAAGIQAQIRGDFAKVRARAEELGMYVEAIIGLPRNGNSESFEQSVRNAKAMGALVVRANAGGRRYEDFSTLAEFQRFKERSLDAVKLAVPIAERHKVPLALENHKDWSVEELAGLLKSYSSEYLGACLDFGNSISLCEDPMEVAEQLAPYALTTHVKDMGVEPYEDGFLLSELRLGEGFLDLERIVSLVRQHHPRTNFNLEMITRDPLKVPVFTDRYWATFPDMRATQLARSMRLVEQHAQGRPLPRVSQLPKEELYRLIENNNVACLRYSREKMKYL
jgi:sugar phosphate isomerase/epimerase